MKGFLTYLNYINLRTIYFNFHYFPIKTAIRLPVLISSRVYLLKMAGEIVLPDNFRPGSIKIGYGSVGIFDRKRSRTIWEVNGLVTFAGTANIGHGAKISVGAAGALSFGNAFVLTAESTIVANKKISFGDNCSVSWEVLVMDTDWHKIVRSGERINPDKQIDIGDHVWIGCRATILKGVKISDHIVVAAGSTVARDLSEQNAIYGGTPLRVLKENILWEL